MSDDEPQFIFLRGVFIQDDAKTFEDEFHDLLEGFLELDEPIPDDTTELPQLFTGLESWPTNPGIPCWHCELVFEHKPVFIPKTIDTEFTRIPVEGCFCGFPCLYAFLEYGIDQKKKTEKKILVDVLYRLITGRENRNIAPTRPRHDMVKYGGKISASEFVNIKEELDPIGFKVLKNIG